MCNIILVHRLNELEFVESLSNLSLKEIETSKITKGYSPSPPFTTQLYLNFHYLLSGHLNPQMSQVISSEITSFEFVLTTYSISEGFKEIMT